MCETLGPKMNDVAGSVTKIKLHERHMRKKKDMGNQRNLRGAVENERQILFFFFFKKFCNVNLNHYGVLVRTLDDLDRYAYYLMSNLF